MSRDSSEFSEHELIIALYMRNDKTCQDIIFNVSRPLCSVASLTVILDEIIVFSMKATLQICNLVSESCREKGLDFLFPTNWIFYFLHIRILMILLL